MLSFSLGPLAISTAHLVGVLALGLATWVARRCQPRQARHRTDSALFWLFVLALVFARLGFVARYWDQYQASPWQVIDARDGGFMPWLGVAMALLVASLLGWRKPLERKALALGLAAGLSVWMGGGWLLLHWQRDTQLPGPPLTNAQGVVASLSQYQGSPLVVNLWASWCPPCRREMPALVDAQRQHPGVRFVFVNQGETPAMAAAFLGAAGISSNDVLFDPSNALLKEVGAVALPTTLFYGPDGQLLGSHLGELSPASLAHALEVFQH